LQDTKISALADGDAFCQLTGDIGTQLLKSIKTALSIYCKSQLAINKSILIKISYPRV
jgi:hypothetical protein